MSWPLGALVAEVRAPAPMMSVVLVTAGKALMPVGALVVQRMAPVLVESASIVPS
jgi:hypothetical protein